MHLLIKGDRVVNIIVPPAEGTEYTPPAGTILVQADGRIGDIWDGTRCQPGDLPTADDVTAERDRRIESGFIFQGKLYQSKLTDRENIAGASQAAFMAITGGVSETKTDWMTDGVPFTWIATDNSLTVMNARTVINFGLAALAAKQAAIFAAYALKAMNPIPTDFADDAFWPAPATGA